MAEKLIKVTMRSTIGYLGKFYGPGEVKVPVGLAEQLGQYRPEPATEPAEDSQAKRIKELEAEVVRLKAQVKPEGEGATGEGTPLPEEFVNKAVRELLVTNGFTTLEKVEAATDEQLLALDGIAEGRLKEIREASTALKTSPQA